MKILIKVFFSLKKDSRTRRLFNDGNSNCLQQATRFPAVKPRGGLVLACQLETKGGHLIFLSLSETVVVGESTTTNADY